MRKLDDLIKQSWFGEKKDPLKEEISFYEANGDKEAVKLLELIFQFKQGEFENKSMLYELINTSKDSNVLNLALKLFTFISKPEDFSKIELFLSEAEEEDIFVFIAYLKNTLSYAIIPILLNILPNWDDTEIASMISSKVGGWIEYYDAMYEICATEELKEAYDSFIQDKDLTKYYYEEELVDISSILGELKEEVREAQKKNAQLKIATIPSLLSNFTGIKCPLDYDTIIDEGRMKKLDEYIQLVKTFDWEVGEKYFYGHKVSV